MNRLKSLSELRNKLERGGHSIGSWIQIPHGAVAEIMGQAGYDWVAVDMEHGSISANQLPDLFRALELGGTLPLVRLAQGLSKDCKQALDAGAAGVIVPMVESAEQLKIVRNVCCWPPAGTRGVGFSRANLFGKHFDAYGKEAQAPLLVAQIEHIRAVEVLKDILQVEGLDAIFIGPYDLSASMGLTAKFNDPDFEAVMHRIRLLCLEKNLPCGVHVVAPDKTELGRVLSQGDRFIAYSIDAVFLNHASVIPEENEI
jgi:2-dehydro-3-deoxyglucarate aldolase